MRIALLALALAALSAQAFAQAPAAAPPTAQQRALAAGYVALTTCSARLTAQAAGGERTLESVRANELRGVYPDLDAAVAAIPADDLSIGYGARWAEQQEPRRALFDPQTGGCVLRPVGSTDLSGREAIDRFDLVKSQEIAGFLRAAVRAPWPVGDAHPIVRPPATLAAVAAGALGNAFGPGTNSTAVIIVREGRIVSESYAAGFGIQTPQRTWSVAKSIAATIVGAAVQRGEVDMFAPAAIDNWQHDGDPRRAITLDDLLHMASGLTSDSAGNRTDGIYFGGVAVDEQAPGWPLIAQPGTVFRYANNDTLLATLAIAPSFATHPPRAFFDSVNMHSTIAETDWRGNYVLSSQVWATGRDLARFGMLYLNDGIWNGTRILPENWRTYVSTPSGPQPPGDFGYGASFWLMNRSAGVPADTIAAFGNRGQYVVIVPSRNIVIVRRGEDPAGSRFDIAAFTRDVLAALE